MKFTERVEELIHEKGITKSQMLADLNLGSGTFATWEKRNSVPNGETVKNIALYFNVTTDYLLGNSPYKTASEQHFHMDEATFRQRFIECFNKSKLSLQDVADNSLVPVSKLQDIIDGKTFDISPLKISTIADILGTTYGYLTGIDDIANKSMERHSGNHTKKLRSVARLESADITPELDENISDFIEFLLKKRDKK